MARFGALDWSGDDRFPMPCDEAEGEVHRAETLAGQSTPPAPFLQVEGRLVDVFEVRISGFVDTWNGPFIEWDFPGQFCFVDPIPDSA